MNRPLNDGLEDESGKRLFLWCSRYISLRYPSGHTGAILLAGI